MGIGDPADPVASDVALNNPVAASGTDAHDALDVRVKKVERSANSELVRQIRWLYDNLPGGPYAYPPP